MRTAALAYVFVVLMMSVATFIAYWLDKRQAARGGRRISERTLHVMAFVGGWPGALIGQQQLRHKTQKISFRIVFWLLLALHLGIVGAVAWMLLNGLPARAPLPWTALPASALAEWGPCGARTCTPKRERGRATTGSPPRLRFGLQSGALHNRARSLSHSQHIGTSLEGSYGHL